MLAPGIRGVGTEARVALEALLERLSITYRRFDHAPVFTCDEATAAIPDAASVQTKNLFLRDKRGRRHLLLVTRCDKPIDIKAFAARAGADHLSFASPERLMRCLGVEPGSVTVLGLMRDDRGAVELYVDADVWHAPLWRCHPLVNSATLVIARVDLERFFDHTGHVPRVVTLDAARPR